jgi:excisionase family DNA binding protein
MIPERLLNISEAAEYLGVTKGTLYVWACRRRVPFVKIGRLTKFDPGDLEKWVAMKKIPTKSFNL